MLTAPGSLRFHNYNFEYCFFVSVIVIKLPENPVDHLDTKLSNSNNTSPMMSSIRSRKKTSKVQPAAHSSRSSIQMFPIISGLVEKQNLGIGKHHRKIILVSQY